MNWPKWEAEIRPRERAIVDLVYWTAVQKSANLDKLVVDLAKSYDRKAWRDDGFLPSFLDFPIAIF